MDVDAWLAWSVVVDVTTRVVVVVAVVVVLEVVVGLGVVMGILIRSSPSSEISSDLLLSSAWWWSEFPPDFGGGIPVTRMGLRPRFSMIDEGEVSEAEDEAAEVAVEAVGETEISFKTFFTLLHTFRFKKHVLNRSALLFLLVEYKTYGHRQLVPSGDVFVWVDDF